MKKRVLFPIIVSVLTVGTLMYYAAPTTSTETSTNVPQTLTVTFSIDGLEEHTTSVTEGTTALALLREEAEDDGFVLIEKEYPGMGILVEQIGEQKNGMNGKYWMFTVNGTIAPVGADVYELKSNDIIEWQFSVPEDY